MASKRRPSWFTRLKGGSSSSQPSEPSQLGHEVDASTSDARSLMCVKQGDTATPKALALNKKQLNFMQAEADSPGTADSTPVRTSSLRRSPTSSTIAPMDDDSPVSFDLDDESPGADVASDEQSSAERRLLPDGNSSSSSPPASSVPLVEPVNLAGWALPGCVAVEIPAEVKDGSELASSGSELVCSGNLQTGRDDLGPEEKRAETPLEDWIREMPRRRSRGDNDVGNDIPATPRSAASERWDMPTETLIILDWDDTLSPTSNCAYMVSGEKPRENETDILPKLEAAVTKFLTVAAALGHVVIVTMADMGWVQTSANMLMPSVAQAIEELGIKVVSARASLPRRLLRSAFADARDPSQFLKTKAMKRVIKQFYRSDRAARPRSWKNVISIGDSYAERRALQDLVIRRKQWDRHGNWQECFCKTLLLLESPSIEQHCKEIDHMKALLPALVQYDGDVDLNVEPDDLETDLSSLYD